MCHVQVCPSPVLVIVGQSWEIQTMSTSILSCGWGAFNRALRNTEGTCNVPSLEAANSAGLLSSVSAKWWQFFTFPSIDCCSVIMTTKQNMLFASHSYLWLLWVLQVALKYNQNSTSRSKIVCILRNQFNTFKLFSEQKKMSKVSLRKLLSNVVRMYLRINTHVNKTLRYYKNPLTFLLISKYHNLELNLRFKLLALMNNKIRTNKLLEWSHSLKG